jgi:alanyl-tRNA synthetase
MIVQDGGLPSNVGGGANCRNILRRVFAILKKNNWWKKLGEVPGLLQLFEEHKKDLSELYGNFADYKSFNDIIMTELKRWEETDSEQEKKLVAHYKKKKNLEIDDWIKAMQSWGIPADRIAQITGLSIPGNLYY